MLPAAPYMYAPAHEVRRMRLPCLAYAKSNVHTGSTAKVPSGARIVLRSSRGHATRARCTQHASRALVDCHSARLNWRARRSRVLHSPYSVPRNCAGARRQWLPNRTKPYTTKFHAHTQHEQQHMQRADHWQCIARRLLLPVGSAAFGANVLGTRVGGLVSPKLAVGTRVGAAQAHQTSGASALCRPNSMRCASKARASAPPSTGDSAGHRPP